MSRSYAAGIAIVLLAVTAATQISVAPSSTAPSSPGVTKPENRPGCVGDAACEACHRDKVEAFHRTSHYLTSSLPEKDSILGSFAADANVMKTSNPELFFRMEQKGDDFFQTAVEGTDPLITLRSERFAFVIGSGGKGQTYLFWKGADLFQLPVSYWSELGWVNSPGYRDGTANFNRPIIPRCLECHGTYFDQIPPPSNRYRKTGFIVGITCEKCHGPGREHAQRFAAKLPASTSSAIIDPARFSRERQMDLCAWCHAGAGSSIAPAFAYVPGESLDKYLTLPQSDPSAPVDVHGSQVEMLERSRCFQKSGMTCLTCHEVHAVQHDLSEFSQRCLSCHKPGSAMFPKQGHHVASDCTGCHMPLQETNLIVFDQNGKKARPKVRNHWIKVYSQ
ncbi:MAG TPA: multiheme c-type cytochrome [Candidatus Deferrimicrobiaceae bacterium]|nr:multiheme c-type cytochrome [Candidatus Deferrimicrobiaceae bacterium]